ncbi:MAG TPA: UDP-N-acetylmuramate dehydrogenase [Candidatus Acidoferrales bacterium]|nr:UDP-N-acetylmuramate dehydrogenase [Candidatus Acidoferrales bacterium]
MRNTSAAALARELLSIPGIRLKLREPLAPHTSIKIGGAADLFLEIETARALAQALRLLNARRVPFWLLGNGSNVLISDRGVRGAVLKLEGEFKRAEWRVQNGEALVTAGAAYPIARLVREAARKGLAGLEFAEGIPATVGGAIVMNAGAYGSEMQKVVARVEGVDAHGEEKSLPREELGFSYRSTCLPPGFIVTRVCFVLLRGSAPEIQERLRALVARRKQTQPAGLPNAGSMFRNPEGDFAGRLIEAAGLKGRRIGRAEISQRHANFIVNLGGARAAEVKRLMDLARREVKEKFAVELVPEVRLIGDWPEEEEERE